MVLIKHDLLAIAHPSRKKKCKIICGLVNAIAAPSLGRTNPE